MEELLIEEFKKMINESKQEEGENCLKEGITVYSDKKQVLIWSLFGASIAALVGGIVICVLMPIKDKLFFGSIAISLVVLSLILIIFIAIKDTIWKKNYLKETLNEKEKKTALLKQAIQRVYFSNQNIEKTDLLLDHVDKLIDSYKEMLENIEKREERRIHISEFVVAVAGAILSFSFDAMDKLGISVEQWMIIVIVFILFSIVFFPLQVILAELMNKKETKRMVLNHLRHLQFMIKRDE